MKEGFTIIRRKSYFKGWYFKNQTDTEVISFIPAYHIDRKGVHSASLQVITPEKSYRIFYPIEEFYNSKGRLAVRLGNNLFSDRGIIINIKAEGLDLSGRLYYTSFHPPGRDIMGPFRYAPLLQCRHSIYSMRHSIHGYLDLNGRRIEFHRGIGYTEGDLGRGFPSRYLWTQCSWRERSVNSLMVSAANVKLGCISFPGCICMIHYQGREYRLATYLGAKILVYSPKELWIKQGKIDIHVEILEKDENNLLAPVKGRMLRTVYESVNARVHYQLLQDGRTLFDFIGQGCYEQG